MIDKTIIEKRTQEYSAELHAGAVYRDIQAREKDRHIHEKRWFWELLQNAKDSVDLDQKIKVSLKTDNDTLIFAHTGNPFQLDEILGLILQGSTKTEDASKTGRFGTGFMTTYLLSKKVEISGKLTNESGYFQFCLNRDAKDLKYFVELQKKSNKDFINSVVSESYLGDSEFQTRFVYKVDEIGKRTIGIGLENLRELIPFVQVFNDQIDTFEMSSENIILSFIKNKTDYYTINNWNFEEFELFTNTSQDSVKKNKAYVVRAENFDVCILTYLENGKEIMCDLKRHPKLFFTFPLIGTEGFGIPFIINSTKFDPRVERDGIYLSSENNNSPEVEENRKIIEESIAVAIEVFTKIIKNKNIYNTFELFRYSNAEECQAIDNNWFNEVKKVAIRKMLNIECLKINEDEKYYRFNELSIPYSNDILNKNSISKLIKAVRSFTGINDSEIENWIEIANRYSEIFKQNILEFSFIVGSTRLIRYIEEKRRIEQLKIETDDSVAWLNDFYTFLISDLKVFPNNNQILLNQDGEFVEAQYLSWDDVQDSELNDISSLIGLNFSEKLISPAINRIGIKCRGSLDHEKAITEIRDRLNAIDNKNYEQANYQIASARFLKWLISNDNVEYVKSLKVLTLEKESSIQITNVQLFPEGKHLLLPPREFIRQSFPLFAELIREKDCMHPVYSEFLSRNEYEWLQNNRFCHCSPVIIRTEKLDINTLTDLVINASDLDKFRDSEGKLKCDIEMEYSDFAYLTNTDGHIYHRNSTTTSSAKIFDFLLNEATEKDPLFCKEPFQYELPDNTIILLNRCLWISRARTRQWVNVRNVEDSKDKKFSSETPSSKNLSELIKQNRNILNSIKEEKRMSFLSRIGVGVSDFIRNTLPSDSVRANWDKALTNMITSNVTPELIQEILNTPNIRQEYEHRLNVRNLIRRNQKIGLIVEKLFREVINGLILEGANLGITREPFGQDFIITDESSDLLNDDNIEEGFRINEWLIELKATGRDYAAMTPLQAETAVNNKSCYAIAIVPLNELSPDTEYVRKNAIVIPDIGSRLSDAFYEYTEVKNRKSRLMTENNGVSVDIIDNQIKFKVNASLWRTDSSMSIDDFITRHFSVTKQLLGS